MSWDAPSRDATDETSNTGARRLYRRLAFLITLLLFGCFLMPPLLYTLYALFLSVLPVLLTGAAVIVGSVFLIRRMKRLYDRYHAALALEPTHAHTGDACMPKHSLPSSKPCARPTAAMTNTATP